MIKLFSWNVNGIRSVCNKGVFDPFIKEQNPDILCLQETKAAQHQSSLELPNYFQYWNSAEKKGYSGTAIFTKLKPISIVNGFPESFSNRFNLVDDATRDSTKEGRLITAEYKKFYLVDVYTPNAKDDLTRLHLRHKHWDPAFLAYLKELEQIKPVVFCGDLNVAHMPEDLANPKQNEGKKGYTKEEREAIDNFIKAGFIDTFRLFTEGNGHYTWWTHWANARARNVGWRIDYFFVSRSLKGKVKNAQIYPQIMGSDHCPVSVTLDI